MKSLSTLFFSVLFFFVFGQQAPTIGLKYYSESVNDGLVLYTPFNGTETFLIDNCGMVVNEWRSEGRPNYGIHLTPEGILYRITTLNTGGETIIEKKDWHDNLLWEYSLSNEEIRMHHDFTVLPNGNVLIIAKDVYTGLEALNAGIDSTNIYFNGILHEQIRPERILEIEPIGLDSGSIVWEWKIWDHLVQDLDSMKNNYGFLEQNPGKFDVNFNFFPLTAPQPNDWLHFNGIDYNAELDQIIFSSRHSSEVYIIDHSTTTDEAASDFGGNYNRGGRFLWRWGNPENYNAGTANEKRLFGQHNPRWIKADNSFTGMISVFNNGDNRPGGAFSSVEIINPEIDSSGNYAFDLDNKFLPDSMSFSWNGAIQGQNLYSIFISSFEVLKNDKLFICEGINGRFIEMDMSGNVDWVYKNPVSDVIHPQGSNNNNWVFKTFKIEADYLQNIDLISDAIIESENSISDTCSVGLVSANPEIIDLSYSVVSQANNIQIISQENVKQICLIDINGKAINCSTDSNELKRRSNSNGLFVLQIQFYNNSNIVYHKMFF